MRPFLSPNILTVLVYAGVALVTSAVGDTGLVVACICSLSAVFVIARIMDSDLPKNADELEAWLLEIFLG